MIPDELLKRYALYKGPKLHYAAFGHDIDVSFNYSVKIFEFDMFETLASNDKFI